MIKPFFYSSSVSSAFSATVLEFVDRESSVAFFTTRFDLTFALKKNCKKILMRGYFSTSSMKTEHSNIEKNTTENVIYFIVSPPGIPNCSGTDANTAAANPFGTITEITLLSKALELLGEKKIVVITLVTTKAKVMIAPIIIHLKSEKGILNPMKTKKNVFKTKPISLMKDFSFSLSFRFLFF